MKRMIGMFEFVDAHIHTRDLILLLSIFFRLTLPHGNAQAAEMFGKKGQTYSVREFGCTVDNLA